MGAVLALLLIGSGRAGRARRMALNQEAISAISFHKPNPRLFIRCVAWLIENGYTFITADEVVEFLHRGKPLPPGAVWLSLDDGWKELADVLPLVRRHQIPVTLFIPSGVIQGDGKFPWLWDPAHPSFSPRHTLQRTALPTDSRDAITMEELLEIAAYPEVTIGAHSVNHSVFPACTDEALRYEVADCKYALESWTGKTVNCFAYPQGMSDGRERRFLIDSGYQLAATTKNAFITRDVNCYLVPRFVVGDEVSFPQAVCSMVGIWRQVADPLNAVSNVAARVLGAFGTLAKERARPLPQRLPGSDNIAGSNS
ncbi:MAG: polysaccharide deacetylase family protein [Bryobacteraceae bacterium]